MRARLSHLYRDNRYRDVSYRDGQLVSESPFTVTTIEDFARLADSSRPYLYDFIVIDNALDPEIERIRSQMSRFACRKLAVAPCPLEFIPESVRKGFAPDNEPVSVIGVSPLHAEVFSHSRAIQLRHGTSTESERAQAVADQFLSLIEEDDEVLASDPSVQLSKNLVITPTDRYSSMLLERISARIEERNLALRGGMIHAFHGSPEDDLQTFLNGDYRFAVGAVSAKNLLDEMRISRIVLTEPVAPNELWALVGAAMRAKPVPAQLIDLADNTVGIHLGSPKPAHDDQSLVSPG